ncbi:unannotated protein [freshwater metagenome]|uniref:Unannotated protein n=1 Tax=freshwater metagenome TaxID=449393 RepID=A0A6J7EP29_9ZZZZ|nr:hypothetical protein [Actinomycetota bacterium]
MKVTTVIRHLLEGDGLPGGPVPGQPGVNFNDKCKLPKPPKPPKIAICDIDRTSTTRKMIDPRTLAEHVRHGDVVPGGAVPGRPGFVFNDNCVAVAAP